MIRRIAVVALVACVVACEKQTPSAPSPPPNPTSTNQPPQIVVGTVTPALGIEAVTIFTAGIEVRDPDGDPIVLAVTGCSFGKDSPATLENGIANLSFKADKGDRNCGSSLLLTATDARGAATQATVPFQRTSLNGRYKLVIGEGFYSQPYFSVNLTQSEAVVTGTIFDDDDDRRGTTDPQQPGTIDSEGRFRLRFKIAPEDDLVLAGVVVSASRDLFNDVMVGSGQVIGPRFAGRAFKLWHEAQF